MAAWLMVSIRLVMLLLLALAAGACKKNEPATHPISNSESSAATAAQTPAPAPGTCANDADCVITCAIAKSCCDQPCEPCEQAMHREELVAHETWRGQACQAETCPVARCRAPSDKTTAHCEAGRCTVRRGAL